MAPCIIFIDEIDADQERAGTASMAAEMMRREQTLQPVAVRDGWF